MKGKLKILHLEDLPADAALIERELKKGGLQFDILLVDNKKDFLAALQSFSPDVILSDHSLPDVDSREALTLTRQYNVKVPFILVTATVSEEYAVEMMKEGAYDYVLKDRYQRLPKAIENAIEKWTIENERQRYLTETIASEARYRQIVETAQEGIWLVDAEFRTTFVNKKVCDILGYSPAEMLGRPNTDFMDAQGQADAIAARERRRKGEGEHIDIRFITKGGETLWASLSTSSIMDGQGNFKGGLAMVTDITERKQAEEKLRQSEANLRAIFDNTSDGFVLLDPAYKIIDYNEAVVSLLLVSSPSGKGRGLPIFELVAPERKALLASYLDRARNGETVEYDVEYKNKTTSRWIHASIIAVTTRRNEFIGYCMTLHDYTEQKKAELQIRSSEERLRALVENSGDIIGVIANDGKVKYISPSAKRLLGYEFKDGDGTGEGFIHRDDRNCFSGYVNELFEKPGQLIQVRFRAKHRNGQWRWLEGSAINLVSHPSVNGIVTNLRDVTDRKLLEEDLQQKKYFLEKAQETAQVGYWISEPFIENARLFWSKETCRIFGLREDEFDGKLATFVKFVHPDDRDKVIAQSHRAIRDEGAYNLDHRIVLRDGGVRWVHEQAEITRDDQGKALQMIGIVQDITERKMIEEVLRQFNERYEILSKATNDAIWDWDIKIGLVTWNHGLQTIFQYPEAEVSYTLDWWESRVHPDDADDVKGSITKAFTARQNNWSSTYRFRCADGRYKYVFDRAYILYNDDREPLRMIGAMQDTTDHMQAMEEIEKLSYVASKTDNSVMITDADTRIEWVNESFVRMTGFTLEEVKGKKPDFLRGAETDEAMVNWMNAKLKYGESVSGEIINYSKTGRKYWLKVDIAPVFTDSGELKNFISIQSDISEQKEFENKITAIARELASLIENANVPIFGIDRNGYINEWNNVTSVLCGFTKSDVIGRKWTEAIVGPENLQHADQMVAHVLNGSPVGNFELPVRTKDNRRLILLLSASPRRDTEKSINGAILVAQDITELIEYRRNLEKIVQDRTRELNEALQKEKELVNMKSKFVSIASHEFRTPLSTISLVSGFLKKFKTKLAPEEIDEKLLNIDKQVGHMTHLLDDILTIGKADAGKIPVRLGNVNVDEFFERLSKEIEQSMGHTHNIRISRDLQVNTMLSDEKLLRNIVINGLTNAIKFSPGAGVVDLILSSDAKKLTLQIRDYGIGIPTDDIKQLFEPFYRASNVNAIQGTGLGLSIIKKAVDLLRGFIDVKSEVGAGTELTITLPVLYE